MWHYTPMFQLLPSREIAVEILGFSVHWYGIMYLLAFVTAAFLLPRLQRLRDLSLADAEWSRILNAAIVGTIVGGRLGHVFFYDPAYYWADPLKAFAVWEGGMSFHGGLIGVALGLFWAMRRWSGDKILRVADVVVVPAALGLAFGRIGNFINFELFGPVTTLPWGMAVPGQVGLHHPTPLYECAYSLVIAAACYLTLRSSRTPGRSFGLFLLLYGVFRFLVEFVRTPDAPLTDLYVFTLTRGQTLTVPVFLLGVFLLWWSARRAGKSGGAARTRPAA